MSNMVMKSPELLLIGENNLEKSLYSAEYMINKSYLPDLPNMSILPTFNI